jgi:predicted nucleic acid-binding protein
LIDYFRKKNKSRSTFFRLTEHYSSFAVSAITEHEIYVGSDAGQDEFWDDFFGRVTVLPFDSEVNREAIKIFRELKVQRKRLDIPDLLIGATALTHGLPLATLNVSHFKLIKALRLIP